MLVSAKMGSEPADRLISESISPGLLIAVDQHTELTVEAKVENTIRGIGRHRPEFIRANGAPQANALFSGKLAGEYDHWEAGRIQMMRLHEGRLCGDREIVSFLGKKSGLRKMTHNASVSGVW